MTFPISNINPNNPPPQNRERRSDWGKYSIRWLIVAFSALTVPMLGYFYIEDKNKTREEITDTRAQLEQYRQDIAIRLSDRVTETQTKLTLYINASEKRDQQIEKLGDTVQELSSQIRVLNSRLKGCNN